MADRYTLKFTPHASADLENIFDYIFETLSNPPAAYRLMDKIESKIEQTAKFPHSGSPVIDEGLNGWGYRKVVMENYIAFYRVDETEKQVIIMRVLYGARDYLGIL